MGRVTAMAAAAALVVAARPAIAQTPDPRLREVSYDAHAVVTVPVRRGVVTHIVLGGDEAITDVGSGLGGDCTKPEAAWCIAAQPGGRNIFVKPKSTAVAPNNLAVVTDRRTHSFRFVVLADADPKPAVFRLAVKAPVHRVASVTSQPREEPLLRSVPDNAALPIPPVPAPTELVSERLKAKPKVLNTHYSLAEGEHSEDIVPTLVFDDGRFTYLKFPGNREVPAVFHVQGDGSETLVNTRMEDDLLVVDRVSRRLMLRAGSAVVGLWNDAFDIDGVPPTGATTVPGVRRTLKADAAPSRTQPSTARAEAPEQAHE